MVGLRCASITFRFNCGKKVVLLISFFLWHVNPICHCGAYVFRVVKCMVSVIYLENNGLGVAAFSLCLSAFTIEVKNTCILYT